MERTKRATQTLVFLSVAIITTALLISNQGHANSKHVEAPAIRSVYSNGKCEGSEMWFSPKLGTILILCGMPESREWGGLVFRVTENFGENWLGENAYECSAFIAKRSYWSNVIGRDSYLPIANYPNIKRLFDSWYN